MIRYERRKTVDLNPDPANPRSIGKKAKAALAASIRRFGLVQPIVVNETTGHVVGGHQRLDALREQGVVDVDVAIGSWTEDEERVLSVVLNNPAAQGEFTDARGYLERALRVLSLDDFQELQLDALVMGPMSKEEKRRNAKALEYKLVVTARDESHQADLLERFEADGLDVKLLIV
jgi:ParB-like chromosome segregation protein Spo0J